MDIKPVNSVKSIFVDWIRAMILLLMEPVGQSLGIVWREKSVGWVVLVE